MKKYKYFAFALMALATQYTFAQNSNVSGKVIDKQGNPLEGALVCVEGNSQVRVATDKNGVFTIAAPKGSNLKVLTWEDATKVVSVTDNKEMTVVMDYNTEYVPYGMGLRQTRAESTGAVSTVHADQIDNRSSFNVGNSLYGNVAGLATMQKTGTVWNQIPSMSIRGLQTLNGKNGILVLVDGLERDDNYNALNYITPEEVESVSVLKDAAAAALYGYRGINGVVNIVTKRGKYRTREISFSYDHAFNSQKRIPKMADAYAYASAMNEALMNDGKSPRYTQNELNAYRSGNYPYLYPNVNWADEVFRDNSSSDIATLTFRGGSMNVRYFTMLNLQNDRGFIKDAEVNDGYSTQNKYSKANFRTNLDIKLTPTTMMQANIMGMLNEQSRPASGGENLIKRVYDVPAAAFPVRTEDGLWGGNSTWSGGRNPVYLAQGRGYSKEHTRSLYADMSLRQDLSLITKGLSAYARIGYDNLASYWEDYRRSQKYGMKSVSKWEDGVPVEFSDFEGGKVGDVVGGGNFSKLNWQHRSFNFQGNVDWKRQFGKHDLYTALIYTYKYDNMNGVNTTWFTQNLASYTHYGYDNRYFADLTLTSSASNRLPSDSRWKMMPTVGLAWVASNEDFWNCDVIDFLKVRASAGIIQTDNIPYNGYWNSTVKSANGYPIDDNFKGDGWAEGRLPSLNGTTEKAYKYNVGFDMSLFKGLNVVVDGFYEHRTDIWVPTSGQNSAVLGNAGAYKNAGTVDSRGVEIALDYTKKIGQVQVSAGGNFSFSRSEIRDMLEEPKAYDYLSKKGNRVGQVYGLQAIGFFVDEADIADSYPQQFGPVKPGDIKYKDVNGDKVINEYDKVPMGYSTQVPEIYYGFNLGAEWKGLGFNAYFQGVANYTAQLEGTFYRPIVDNNNITQYYYDNRWTTENPNARFPRLTNESVDNNKQTSSVWLADRSFMKMRNAEIYYKLPADWISKIMLKKAKVYVRGVDLFCIDNDKLTDPEISGSLTPATKSIHVGLSIGL